MGISAREVTPVGGSHGVIDISAGGMCSCAVCAWRAGGVVFGVCVSFGVCVVCVVCVVISVDRVCVNVSDSAKGEGRRRQAS